MYKQIYPNAVMNETKTATNKKKDLYEIQTGDIDLYANVLDVIHCLCNVMMACKAM